MNKLWVFPALVLLALILSTVSSAVAQSSLRVGAARVDITPASDPASHPSDKYDDEKLYVRAIVVECQPAPGSPFRQG